MKKTLFFFAAAAMALAACNKAEHGPSISEQDKKSEELIPVRVQLSGAVTKAAADENTISTLQIVLYRINDEVKTYESFYEIDPAKLEGTIYIDPSKAADKYLIAAYANQKGMSEGTHAQDWSLFSNETAGDFQMYGEWLDNKAKLGNTVSISLKRQCSKISVNKVSLKWTNNANNYKTFKLKSMYIMDAMGALQNVHSISSSISWLNKNGYTQNSQDAFLYKNLNSIEVTEKDAYSTSNTFYAYLSELGTFNTTENWVEGGSRLVIEAEFDGENTYYAIPLKKDGISGSFRNKHFIFDEIVITKPGADTPYGALTTENAVTVSFNVENWGEVKHGTVTIQ